MSQSDYRVVPVSIPVVGEKGEEGRIVTLIYDRGVGDGIHVWAVTVAVAGEYIRQTQRPEYWKVV